MKFDFFISIVVFNPNLDVLKKSIEDLVNKENIYIGIFDNSNLQNVMDFCQKNNVKYLSTHNNIGFGRGHNKNIKSFNIHNNSLYTVIMNPDIFLKYEQLFNLLNVFTKEKNVGIVSPLLLNPDGSIQHSVRCFPNIFSFFINFFGLSKNFSKKIINTMEVPFIHGALYVLKTNIFFRVNGFDDQYFLYCEDIDICAKICNIGLKNIIYPNVYVTHLHQKESHKNIFLFCIHIISILKYVLKWRTKNCSQLDSVNKNFLKNFK